MKIIIPILVVAFLLACSPTKKEGELVLFNDITFGLSKNESVTELDSSKKATFNKLLEGLSIQVPLFKCIKGDNYLIYLGIPINTSIKELSYNHSINTNHPAVFEIDSSNYFYMKHQNGTNHITTYSKSFDNNIIYVLTVSPSTLISDSLFNKSTISKRFIK